MYRIYSNKRCPRMNADSSSQLEINKCRLIIDINSLHTLFIIMQVFTKADNKWYSVLAMKVRVVNSRLRGGERVSSFEYGMPMGKEKLWSSIPVSWS